MCARTEECLVVLLRGFESIMAFHALAVLLFIVFFNQLFNLPLGVGEVCFSLLKMVNEILTSSPWMINAYLSYRMAAFDSEVIAPKYFLASPLTIITYNI